MDRVWKVSEKDSVSYFKTRENNANFVFTDFSKYDRANKEMVQMLYKAIRAAADYAAEDTKKTARHDLVARTLFWNKFGVYFTKDRHLVVPAIACLGVNSMQSWAQFEAVIRYAISIW